MRVCKDEGCNNKHEALGYCEKHYKRFRKYGNTLIVKQEYHGMTHTPEYRVWQGMKARCYNKNDKSYYRYGGRGITVCDEWKDSFLAFLKDMGKRPSLDHQIDRIDNDGNYEPGNCRWVTPVVNAQNRSTTKLNTEKVRNIRIKYATDNFTMKELSLEYNVSSSLIGFIINHNNWVTP